MPHTLSDNLDNSTKREPITTLGDDTGKIPDFRFGSKRDERGDRQEGPLLEVKRTKSRAKRTSAVARHPRLRGLIDDPLDGPHPHADLGGDLPDALTGSTGRPDAFFDC